MLTINRPNILSLQFRHVLSDWVMRTRSIGLYVEREAERIRRAAVKAGWEVEPPFVVEDWRRDTEDNSV